MAEDTRPEMQPGSYFDYDQYHLDDEWHSQPAKMRESSLRMADANRDYEMAKADFRVVEAEIKQDIRHNPSRYRAEKLTEDSIKEIMVLQVRWQTANKKVIDAEHWLEVCKADVATLKDRRPALEKTTDLFMVGYFSKPRAGRGAGSQAAEENQSESAFGHRISRRNQ